MSGQLGSFRLLRFFEKPKSILTIHYLEANPEQSKHLETATVKILGLQIDCVNLRAETYAGIFLSLLHWQDGSNDKLLNFYS